MSDTSPADDYSQKLSKDNEDVLKVVVAFIAGIGWGNWFRNMGGAAIVFQASKNLIFGLNMHIIFICEN